MAMFGKLLSWFKPRYTYWMELVKEAQTTSQKLGEAAGNVFGIIKFLAPGAVTWAAARYTNLKPSSSVLYSVVATGAWIVLLLLDAAYKKHKIQKDKIKEMEVVQLKLEGIQYQRDLSASWENVCGVKVRNTSSKVAENVHVRMSGEVITGIFVDGFSPFNEADLRPASGSRSINPHSESDWLFPESFNHLVSSIANTGINVVSTLYRNKQKQKEPVQMFSVEVSAASSVPLKAAFEIVRDQHGKLQFNRLAAFKTNTEKPLIQS